MGCPRTRTTNSTVLLLLAIVIAAAIFTIEFDVRYKLFFGRNISPILTTQLLQVLVELQPQNQEWEWVEKHRAEGHSEHKLCLLVPFHDRAEELLKFVPHISKFLSKQQIRLW